MKVREILATNLRKLRAATPSLNSFDAIVKATGIGNGTIGRILSLETSLTIDKLELLAEAYQAEPWQLLCPTLEAHATPSGTPIISGVPEWPFPLVDMQRFDALSDKQKIWVQAKLDGIIGEAANLPPWKMSPAPKDLRVA